MRMRGRKIQFPITRTIQGLSTAPLNDWRGSDALRLHPVALATRKVLEKIEVPVGAPEFAVGDG